MARIKTATWVGNGQSGGSWTGGPPKSVAHCTVTPGNALPTYAGGTMAPHVTLTVDVVHKTVKPYQHTDTGVAARALENRAGGVQTNRDRAFQFELSGTCEKDSGYFYIPEAPDWYWDQVADFLAPVHESLGIQNVLHDTDWRVGDPRLSFSQWDNFNGVTAHMFVPENGHWDFPLAKARLAYWLGRMNGTRPAEVKVPVLAPRPIILPHPAEGAPKFPLPAGHWLGEKSSDPKNHSGYAGAGDREVVRTWQAQMRRRGWHDSHGQLLDVDGFFGGESTRVARLFQGEKHLGVDGHVGAITWKASFS